MCQCLLIELFTLTAGRQTQLRIDEYVSDLLILHSFVVKDYLSQQALAICPFARRQQQRRSGTTHKPQYSALQALQLESKRASTKRTSDDEYDTHIVVNRNDDNKNNG